METFTAEVIDISFAGKGVIKLPDGRVCFVDDVVVGDIGEFVITSQKKNFAFALLKKLLTSSPYRVEAECKYQVDCGGCPWMIIDYANQLQLKEKLVRQTAFRNKITLPTKIEVYPSSQSLGYRNRAKFVSDGKKVGFKRRESEEIIDIDHCLVLDDVNNTHLRRIREMLASSNSKNSKAETFDIYVDDDMSSNEEIIFNKQRPFKQANTSQNQTMQEILKLQFKNLDFKPSAIVELFCGSGNFTKILNQYSPNTKVLALESDSKAIKTLNENKWTNVKADVCDIYNFSSLKKFCSLFKGAEILILDPPRTGFADLSKLSDLLPKLRRIYYVSCDPVSFFSDIKPVLARNWRINQLSLVDMFPHTPHIELVVSINRDPSLRSG